MTMPKLMRFATGSVKNKTPKVAHVFQSMASEPIGGPPSISTDNEVFKANFDTLSVTAKLALIIK